MPPNKNIDQVINIAGLLQPQSTFLVSKTLERVGRGGVVEIVTDNRNSGTLLHELGQKNKFKIIGRQEVLGFFHFTIVKN